jgi:hypothetical protein
MSILSFPKFRKKISSQVDPGWSQMDMAEFYRAHKLLNDQGIRIGLEQGVTDESDPWLVFYDIDSHDVFLHIARIDGKCILVCEHLSLNIQETQIDALIKSFEHSIRTILDTRAKSGNNVIIHPAARIITTVAAVFLLFKLENNKANAAAFFEDSSPNNNDNIPVLHNEYRYISPHRNQISRVFDIIDTPMHAAIMAGIVISYAIADSHIALAESKTDNVPFLVAGPKQEDFSSTGGSKYEVDHLHQNDFASIEIIYIYQSTKDYNPSISEYIYTISVFDKYKDFLSDRVVFHEMDENIADINFIDSNIISDENVEPALSYSNTDSIRLLASELDVNIKFQIIKIISEYNINSDSIYHITFNKDDLFSFIEELEGIDVGNNMELNITTDRPNTADVSIKDIEYWSSKFGAYYKTKLLNIDTAEMSKILFSQIESFDIQIYDGNILIEQTGMDDSSLEVLGLWTNVLQDGSEISFVGAMDIIDDVEIYIA